MQFSQSLALAVPMAALLWGCSAEPQAPATPEAASPTGSVIREEVAPPPPSTPPPLPAAAAIQTQAGPKGSQVTLNKISVTGDIMTVQVTYDGGSEWQTPDLRNVSIIDDATSQRISVIKDGDDNYLASPLNAGVKSRLGFRLGEGPQIVWFKFPAPPATSKSISLTIPDVVPFDGVPVTR